MQEHSRVELLDVIAFIRVVETGSIGNAAARLGIAKSMVSRRVSRLEGVLGAQLLTRTPRGPKATDIG
ncbi:MAG: LysR family transcriptional regulator, partial [Gammaproteobacteria bacterium]|nr:LysR family transcriptional regulator [Gammaproteobacteria bacterium]